MAKVEQTEDRVLPSPAVGVPQIDTSSQQIAQGLGKNIGEISDVKYERQKLADNIAAEAHASAFALQGRELINDVNKSFYGTDVSPDDQLKEVQRRMTGLQNDYMKGMTSQGQKNAFAMKSAEITKNQYQDAYTQALSRQTQQVHSNAVVSANNISDQNAQIWRNPDSTEDQKYQSMHGLLSQLEGNLATVQKLLPPEQFSKLRDDSLKNFAKSAIFGAMDTNPDLARKLIQDKTFESQLTIEEQSQLTRDAISYSKSMREEGKIGQAVVTAEGDRDILSRLISKDPNVQKPSISDIEKARAAGVIGMKGGLSEKGYEAAKSLVKVINEGDDTKFTQRMAEYNSLFKSDGNMASKFNKLATFQASLANDVSEGTITKDTASAFMTKINNDFKDGINTNFNNANRVKKSGFDFFGVFADRMIKGKDEQTAAKNYMQSELMKKINDAESTGSKVSQDEINTMSKDILNDYLRQNNPSVMGAKEVTNNLITQTGGTKPLHQIPTSIPGAQKVRAPEQPLIIMTAPDGQKVKVHPSKINEAIKRGLKR